ncbi:MAG: hypothetical protein GVY21_04385 [Gammaproteobacteria bacterium]|jgi:flagellar biosynthesis/type III secretory pathway M-ring protein FliF/YscJ|nr:hypothetical protein [Gammaproteobacteria bacterium]
MSSAHVFVIVLVAIVLLAGIAKEYLRHHRREEDPKGDEELEATVARLEELEERVRVLERIVTDPQEGLRREINRL